MTYFISAILHLFIILFGFFLFKRKYKNIYSIKKTIQYNDQDILKTEIQEIKPQKLMNCNLEYKPTKEILEEEKSKFIQKFKAIFFTPTEYKMTNFNLNFNIMFNENGYIENIKINNAKELDEPILKELLSTINSESIIKSQYSNFSDQNINFDISFTYKKRVTNHANNDNENLSKDN